MTCTNAAATRQKPAASLPRACKSGHGMAYMHACVCICNSSEFHNHKLLLSVLPPSRRKLSRFNSTQISSDMTHKPKDMPLYMHKLLYRVVLALAQPTSATSFFLFSFYRYPASPPRTIHFATSKLQHHDQQLGPTRKFSFFLTASAPLCFGLS